MPGGGASGNVRWPDVTLQLDGRRSASLLYTDRPPPPSGVTYNATLSSSGTPSNGVLPWRKPITFLAAASSSASPAIGDIVAAGAAVSAPASPSCPPQAANRKTTSHLLADCEPFRVTVESA